MYLYLFYYQYFQAAYFERYRVCHLYFLFLVFFSSKIYYSIILDIYCV